MLGESYYSVILYVHVPIFNFFSLTFPVYADPEICYGTPVSMLTSAAGNDMLGAVTSTAEFSLFSEDV